MRTVGKNGKKHLYLPSALSSLTHFFNLAKFAGIPAATVVPKQPEGVWILRENAKIPTWRMCKTTQNNNAFIEMHTYVDCTLTMNLTNRDVR